MVDNRVIDQLIETANNAIGRITSNHININARVQDVAYKDAQHILGHYNDSYNNATEALKSMRDYLESLQ